jgi:small-conductance mechanosensitive channel
VTKKPFKFDVTHYKFFKHCLTGLIYFIGFSFAITMIPPLKSVAFSLLASSGVIAIIIGFASQQTFSNIISGLFLDVFRPFELGHKIKVGQNYSGTVEDITLRHTVLKTSENNFVVIPNATINNEIVENETWHDQRVRTAIDIYIDHKADTEKALEIINSIVEANPHIIGHHDETDKKKPTVKVETRVFAITLAGVHIKCWFWAPNGTLAKDISYDSYQKIKAAFAAQDIQFARCTCS